MAIWRHQYEESSGILKDVNEVKHENDVYRHWEPNFENISVRQTVEVLEMDTTDFQGKSSPI